MDDFHSRETLAGYDRTVMEEAVVTFVGAGMLGNNAAQTLALSGVREIRVVDFDVIDPSNLTRSPLFRREHARLEKPRAKARELTASVLAISYADAPRVRFATARLEELGLGALVGSSVVVGAVDNHAARALLADWTRLLGIPYVESGVAGHSGHVSVFRNATADEPCWRCAFPMVETGGLSCGKYAAAVSAAGRIPATQALGATFGAGLLAEHAILALHGEFPLAGSMLELDLRSGRTNVLRVTADPDCPGAHRHWRDIRALSVGPRDPLEHVFAALDHEIAQPRIRLPFPYVVEAPCANCGASVRLGKPDFAIATPSCRSCSPTPIFGGRGIVARSVIEAGDPEAKRACRAFGLGAGAIFEVASARADEAVIVSLAGGVDEIFTTRTRAAVDAATIEADSDPRG